MNRMNWILGILTSFIGVVLVKVVTPAGVPGKGLMVAGYLMALGGILVIADGIRRRSERRRAKEEQAGE